MMIYYEFRLFSAIFRSFDFVLLSIALTIFAAPSIATESQKSFSDQLPQLGMNDTLPIINSFSSDNISKTNHSAPPSSKETLLLKPSVELSSEYSRLSNGYGNAHTEMLKYTHFSSIGVVDISATHQSRFGAQGTYLSIQLTRELSDRNYFRVAAGGGESILWPHWRGDYSIHHKFGPEKKYVAGLGLMYASNRDNRSDTGLSVNLISYFDQLILEAGLLFYRNNPGWVRAGTQFVAATWGANKIQTLSLRAENSHEAYLATRDNFLVNFDSTNFSLTWRYWLTPDHALILGGRQYKNSFYKQTAIKVGVEINLP